MSDAKKPGGDDFFSETPSADHARAVREAVTPILADHRKRSRRGLLGWIAGGVVFASACVAGVVLVRDRGAAPGEEFAELDALLFDESSGDEVFVIGEAEGELDFDLFDDLDVLESLNDDDFENV
ncbi:MAG: hypothetical protein AAB250_00390 [Bdellovibrionota bacterium]